MDVCKLWTTSVAEKAHWRTQVATFASTGRTRDSQTGSSQLGELFLKPMPENCVRFLCMLGVSDAL
eukprot:7563413-Lingulodinium_polyedra.AAC.1